MPKETFLKLPEDKRERVMRASISEFINHGFEKGNVGDIAKKAGVAKGSMYQYFENKKELFLYCVKWSMEFFLKKYAGKLIPDENMDIFQFFYQNSKDIMEQIKQERDIVIFIQDVFLGRYQNLTGESLAYMNRMSEEHVLKLIRAGKKNGTIRNDIDDYILILYLTGVTYKIKEYIMNKARNAGEDIIDEEYERYEHELTAMLELLKNGMGGR